MPTDKPQHTPGPWKIAPGIFGATVFAGDPANPRIISDMAASDPENVANAIVMRAALELLQAAKVCLDAERERRRDLKLGAPATTYCERRIAMIEAAIAKAEGRS